MKRLAVLLLAGATFVAAQTTTETPDKEMEQITTRMQERLHQALENAGASCEEARKAAMECQNQMKGKSSEEMKKIMEQRRTEAQERLDKAIEAIDQASEKVGAQVEEVRERIQSRLQEKKAELEELQTRIRDRQQLHDGTGEGGVHEGAGGAGKGGTEEEAAE